MYVPPCLGQNNKNNFVMNDCEDDPLLPDVDNPSTLKENTVKNYFGTTEG
jgi:hypothetical protein